MFFLVLPKQWIQFPWGWREFACITLSQSRIWHGGHAVITGSAFRGSRLGPRCEVWMAFSLFSYLLYGDNDGTYSTGWLLWLTEEERVWPKVTFSNGCHEKVKEALSLDEHNDEKHNSKNKRGTPQESPQAPPGSCAPLSPTEAKAAGKPPCSGWLLPASVPVADTSLSFPARASVPYRIQFWCSEPLLTWSLGLCQSMCRQLPPLVWTTSDNIMALGPKMWEGIAWLRFWGDPCLWSQGTFPDF